MGFDGAYAREFLEAFLRLVKALEQIAKAMNREADIEKTIRDFKK